MDPAYPRPRTTPIDSVARAPTQPRFASSFTAVRVIRLDRPSERHTRRGTRGGDTSVWNSVYGSRRGGLGFCLLRSRGGEPTIVGQEVRKVPFAVKYCEGNVECTVIVGVGGQECAGVRRRGSEQGVRRFDAKFATDRAQVWSRDEADVDSPPGDKQDDESTRSAIVKGSLLSRGDAASRWNVNYHRESGTREVPSSSGKRAECGDRSRNQG